MSAKAWQISDNSYEDCAVIVFSDTPGKAKALGSNLLDCEFVDSLCARAPEADKFSKKNLSHISWETEEGCLVYRELGWRSHEDGAPCEECGETACGSSLGPYGDDLFCTDCLRMLAENSEAESWRVVSDGGNIDEWYWLSFGLGGRVV